jgi:tripartite-type tricarboxylate transporter receptor subunit TctC
VPVANLGTASFVLVVPTACRWQSLADFVAYAKARGPASCRMRHVGRFGDPPSTEMFARQARESDGDDPVRGHSGGDVGPDDGRTQFMSTGVIAALPQIKAAS